MTDGTGGSHRDDGAATPLVLALAMLLTAALGLVAVTGEVALVRHRAAAVADLAALGAAGALITGRAGPCEAARSVTTAAGLVLVACVASPDGSVQVAVRGRPGPLVRAVAPGAAGPVVRARAGPVRGPPGLGDRPGAETALRGATWLNRSSPAGGSSPAQVVGRTTVDLSLATRTEGDKTVIAVGGEIDVYTAPKLREQIVQLVEEHRYHLVVDMEDVEFLDSTGLGVLVGGLKRVRAHDGSLHLVCTQERILKIFRITGLTKVFPIHASVAEAVAAQD